MTTESQAQICGDGALLLWFAAGALREQEAAQVARHVDACSRCQELVRENKWLGQQYRSLAHPQAEHLAAEALIRIATGEEGANLAEAREHLAGCDECGQIAATVRRVQQDMEPGVIEKLRAAWQEVPGLAWMQSPIPAYVLALLLLYPAYLGLVAKPDHELRTPALIPSPVPIASEVERGPGEPLVRVDPQRDRTVLTFFVPVAPERFRYELELRNKRGRRIFFDRDAKSFDGIGTFALSFPPGSLGAGEYELRIAEIEREGDGDEPAGVYEFPFSVGTQ